MSRSRVVTGPGALAAFGSRARDVARTAVLALPARAASPRDAAFHGYAREWGRRLKREPERFRVRELLPVAFSAGGRIVEIVLEGPAVDPGDMLYALWRNPDEAVDRRPDAVGSLHAYWSTPGPGRPSRWERASGREALSAVVDLAEDPEGSVARLLRSAPRIVPRLYTVSGARADETRILVSARAEWPRRAAAHLVSLRPGDELRAWIMPHPHRLPPLHGHEGAGLVVVTGSGIAGALAALRAGRGEGARLVSGVRGDVAPAVRAELEGLADGGAIRRLDVAVSTDPSRPRRVTDVLAELPADARSELADGWAYVSGHSGMAAPVRALLADLYGPAELERMAETLRYIEST